METYRATVGNLEFTLVKGLRYTDSDEWARRENGVVKVGVTDYAQKRLTDIVGVDLPRKGAIASKGDPVATLESMKAIADIYAPVSGRIVEVNERLYEEPGLVNRDPYGEGWLFAVEASDPSEYESLLDDAAYLESVRRRYK